MQLFLETAKGGCTTFQEVTHSPHAADLPFKAQRYKTVTKYTAAVYKGDGVGKCGQQKGTPVARGGHS